LHESLLVGASVGAWMNARIINTGLHPLDSARGVPLEALQARFQGRRRVQRAPERFGDVADHELLVPGLFLPAFPSDFA
jgi:hypothetical protein